MDQILWMKALSFHGKSLLRTVANEDYGVKLESTNEKEKIANFIAKKKNFLFQQLDSPKKALKKTSPLMPIEIFQDCSPEERRELFYKTLNRGSIVYAKVINDILPDNYKLLVLAKPYDCMKLDDLSIVMYLPKLEQELKHVKDKLVQGDYLKAAVCSCSVNERKLFVTLDSNMLEEDDAQGVTLGKVSYDVIPVYVGTNDTKWKSYVGYLHSLSSFHRQNLTNELNSLNVDTSQLHSFFKEWDRKQYPLHQYADQIKLRNMSKLSNIHLTRATEKYYAKMKTDAFLCVNKALDIYPKNVEALVFRGFLYFSNDKFANSFEDLERAIHIDPSHKSARKHMSMLLVKISKLHIADRDFEKAKQSLKEALKLGKCRDASRLLKKIHEIESRKHSGKKSKRSPGHHKSSKKDDRGSSSPSHLSRHSSSSSIHSKVDEPRPASATMSRHSSSSSVQSSSKTDDLSPSSSHHRSRYSDWSRHHSSEKKHRHHHREKRHSPHGKKSPT